MSGKEIFTPLIFGWLCGIDHQFVSVAFSPVESTRSRRRFSQAQDTELLFGTMCVAMTSHSCVRCICLPLSPAC